MKAQVALHVRESRSGRAVVTPIPFVELAHEAMSAEAAVADLRPVLEARIADLDPVDRLSFAELPDAHVLQVPTEVMVGGKGGERLQIRVGLVVVRRLVGETPVLVAYVPVIPGCELVAADGDLERLTTRVAKLVAGRLRSWSAEAVLNADEPDECRLDVVTLDVEERGTDDFEALAPPQAPGEPSGILDELGVALGGEEGPRIDGREDLITRVLETLAAPGRSSVLLVGPVDVGKTALVHEVARRMLAGEVPDSLRERRVWRLTANELIAGAQYTGMWQDRARRLIQQAKRTRAIVAMGDPVGIVDAGRWSKSDNNVARHLRPYVESGDITLVCECTPDQLAAALRQEPSFVGAFHRIDVPEPTLAETRLIVAAAAERLGGGTSVDVAADAVDAAVELTGRFEPYRGFPGKAIQLLEDAARDRGEGSDRLGRSGVTEAFARRSGMPLELLSDDVPLSTVAVREYFESRILGQPGATATVADLVAVLKAGLSDPQKPLATLFFVGPTGVGKTELAKALAEFLFGSRQRLVRFDMGEYASADAVQRLIGTAWGSQEGELTRRVREQPFCVVLLDEIEKANEAVFDALLAAIGEGRLTDAAGRVAEFRNAIVIMTSNLGARRTRSGALGFAGNGASSDDAVQHRYVEEAEKFFRPEFFNRIDRVVVFHALTAQTVRQIARRELDRLLLREGIVRRRLLVEVDESVVEAVAEAGFHPRYGARPLQREIERSIIQPLARLIVDRRPGSGELVRVHLREGVAVVDIEKIRAEREEPTRRRREEARVEAPFAKAERAALAFVDLIDRDEASARADEVRSQLSGLIARSNEPTFWDEPDRARATLERIYTLEHLLTSFDALRERAAGLTEMAKRVRQARDRGRVNEIPRALEEMDDRLVVLRLELAAAAGGAGGGAAVVRVVPLGKDATSWAERLLAMYAAWGERTARTIVPYGGGELAVQIEGPATFDILAAESGLHRHVLPDRAEELARISVELPGAPPSVDDAGMIVRVYEEGKRRFVRDPRTGVRDSRVAAVIDEGRIEAFLIAGLRRAAFPTATVNKA